MIKADLERAGIKYKTEEGTAHFHAQRHGFATRLAHSSKSIKTAQRLMRHSDIRTTEKHYIHPIPKEEKDAIESLPNFMKQPLAKTGTDNQDVTPNTLAKSFDKQSSSDCSNLHYSAQKAENEIGPQTGFSAPKNAVFSGKSQYPRCDSNAQPLAPEANALSN